METTVSISQLPRKLYPKRIGNIFGILIGVIAFIVFQSDITLAITSLLIGYVLSGFYVINQYEKGVKFRLGKFTKVQDSGINFILPFVEWVYKVDIRIRTVDIPAQEVITKDNVPVNVNGVVYFKVLEPSKVILNVLNYEFAVAQYSQTALRDVVGKTDLDDLLSKREKVASEIRRIVDEIVSEWGIDIVSINLQDVFLPKELVRAMARQAEAERERRATIIKSQGEIQTAQNLAYAASIMQKVPESFHLRTLYTLVDISSDPNQKTVIFLPIELIKSLKKLFEK